MSLSNNDKNRITSFYREALEAYGTDDPRGLHWTDARNQLRRFSALCFVDDLQESSVLDVGSGLGDLYDFLQSQGFSIDYTGIDIVPDMVEQARHKFPEVRFETRDIFDVQETFDYVLASGALSFKVENNDEYYKAMIEKMYEIAHKAVAFNMLDRNTHPDTETYATYKPEDIAQFCSSFAGRVEVATDYLPQDFTVYLYKE